MERVRDHIFDLNTKGEQAMQYDLGLWVAKSGCFVTMLKNIKVQDTPTAEACFGIKLNTLIFSVYSVRRWSYSFQKIGQLCLKSFVSTRLNPTLRPVKSFSKLQFLSKSMAYKSTFSDLTWHQNKSFSYKSYQYSYFHDNKTPPLHLNALMWLLNECFTNLYMPDLFPETCLSIS